MKVLVILLFSFNLSIAQVVTGKYACWEGSYKLHIRNDSIFFKEWRGHRNLNWHMGTWSIKNKIITFNPIPIFDTIQIRNSDTLVLSFDTISQRLTYNQYQELLGDAVYQDHDENDEYRLMYENDKLFYLNSKGKPIKKYKGNQKRISLRNKRLDKPPIVLFSWKKKYPACIYERVK